MPQKDIRLNLQIPKNIYKSSLSWKVGWGSSIYISKLNCRIGYQICSTALSQNKTTVGLLWVCLLFNATAPSTGHKNTGLKN